MDLVKFSQPPVVFKTEPSFGGFGSVRNSRRRVQLVPVVNAEHAAEEVEKEEKRIAPIASQESEKSQLQVTPPVGEIRSSVEEEESKQAEKTADAAEIDKVEEKVAKQRRKLETL